jgi:hypothetical protein
MVLYRFFFFLGSKVILPKKAVLIPPSNNTILARKNSRIGKYNLQLIQTGNLIK